MRLINTSTLKLESFADNVIPRYAALSHTWGKEGDEVSFQEMQSGDGPKKRGWGKIEYSCKQALSDKLAYVWIDTCCIDKSSSAELSEAINSMYKWYANAVKCYAFLEDMAPSDPSNIGDGALWDCRWFTRAWTLQELIAPHDLTLFARDWSELGTKERHAQIISEITGIDQRVLHDPSIEVIQQFSVAARMSWASHRVCTRVEDMAYSLLGIFDVNMPMLYGEGEKAFIRLQEEIMKYSYDESLFAWEVEGRHACPDCKDKEFSFLAPNPAAFKSARDIVAFLPATIPTPFSMTNRGLRIDIPVGRTDEGHFALINCYHEKKQHWRIAVPIREPDVSQPDLFARSCKHMLRYIRHDDLQVKGFTSIKTMYFGKKLVTLDYVRTGCFWIQLVLGYKLTCKVVKVEPSKRWDKRRHIILHPNGDRPYADPWNVAVLLQAGSKQVVMMLGADLSDQEQNLKPWAALQIPKHELSSDDDLEKFRETFIDQKHPRGQLLRCQMDRFDVFAKISKEWVMGHEMFVAKCYIYLYKES